MYSRSYQSSEMPAVPESYSGVAFREPSPPPEDAPRSIARSADVKFTPTPDPPDPKLTSAVTEPEESVETAAEGGGFLSGLMDKIPVKGIFSGLSTLKLGGLGVPKLGTEEILILGLALFLFFSRDGDKECALFLVLLLFIK